MSDFSSMNWSKSGSMNEWTSEWVSEWVSEWTDEWMNEWINESMNQWINESMNEWMNEWMNQSINQSINHTTCCSLCGWHDDKVHHGHSSVTRKFANFLWSTDFGIYTNSGSVRSFWLHHQGKFITECDRFWIAAYNVIGLVQRKIYRKAPSSMGKSMEPTVSCNFSLELMDKKRSQPPATLRAPRYDPLFAIPRLGGE